MLRCAAGSGTFRRKVEGANYTWRNGQASRTLAHLSSPAINSLFMLFPKYSAKQHSNKEAIFASLRPDAVGGRLCRC